MATPGSDQISEVEDQEIGQVTPPLLTQVTEWDDDTTKDKVGRWGKGTGREKRNKRVRPMLTRLSVRYQWDTKIWSPAENLKDQRGTQERGLYKLNCVPLQPHAEV